MARVPGLSRSGCTICTGLFTGLGREWATGFALPVSLPILAGAREGQDMLEQGPAASRAGLRVIGVVASCLTGLLATRLVVQAVRARKLRWFGVYCLAVGVLVLAGHFAGLIS